MQNKEKHSQAAVLGLQHLLAMYSGSILVPIMIAGALGYSAHELTYLISTDIFMCGVATFLQLQLNKYFGIGLPVVLGVAFQSVAPLIMIGEKHGSGAMFGALIVSGIYVILVSGVFSKSGQSLPFYRYRISHYNYWFDPHPCCNRKYGEIMLISLLVKASSLPLSPFLSSLQLIFSLKDLSNPSQS